MANCELSSETLEALRSEYKHRSVHKGKYPRQKMLPEYKTIYPWVIPDNDDPYFAFCTVCECRLRAKRTDLGKHEGSFKHAENAKKGKTVHDGSQAITPTATHNSAENKIAENTVESENYDEDNFHIKLEPIVFLDENSNSAKDYEVNQGKSDEDETDEDEADDDNMNANNTIFPNRDGSTSSTSDSLSQHSGPLDYMPVTISERFSIREIPNTGMNQTGNVCHYPSNSDTSYPMEPRMGLSTTQTPCKITIKKITAPIVTATQATVVPSQATITAVPASITLSHQPTHSSTIAPNVISKSTFVASSSRDPLELFFDSICASVKALPPKLATEGKIRVMQLIGELEIRAIDEREQIDPNCDTKATFPQNSMVASTTK